MGRQNRQSFGNVGNFDFSCPAIGQPIGIPVIGNNHVERAIGIAIKGRQRLCRINGVGMIKGLKRQFPAGPFVLGRAKGAKPVQNGRDNAIFIDTKPGASGRFIQPGHNIGTIIPVTCRGFPRAIVHFVAIGADDHRPVMVGAA